MLSYRLSKTTILAMVLVGTAAWLSFGVLAVVNDDGTRVGVFPPVSLLALTIRRGRMRRVPSLSSKP